jgi:cell division protein FtsQ
MARVNGGRRTAPRVVTDRPTRGNLLMRRLRRLLRPVAWGTMALALVVLVLTLVRSADSSDVVGSGRATLGGWFGLRVASVLFEGRENTPEPLLRAALGITTGDSLIGFSVAAARARIQTLSWVENASVERRLPDTLVVKLKERRPFAIWQNQKRYQLIDRDGQVVGDQDVAAFSQLPLVVGADAPAHAADILRQLATYPALQSHVAAVVRVSERRWNLRLNNGGDVLLPEGNENAALARLAQLQASNALLDRPLADVDMRLPDRLVIRPRGESSQTSPNQTVPAQILPNQTSPIPPIPPTKKPT